MVVESFVELEVAVVAVGVVVDDVSVLPVDCVESVDDVDCVESVDEVDPDAVVAAPVAACARATVA